MMGMVVRPAQGDYDLVVCHLVASQGASGGAAHVFVSLPEGSVGYVLSLVLCLGGLLIPALKNVDVICAGGVEDAFALRRPGVLHSPVTVDSTAAFHLLVTAA